MPTMPPRFRPAHLPTRTELRRTYDAKRARIHDWRAWYKDRRWHAIRARQLRDHPLCRMCLDAGLVNDGSLTSTGEPQTNPRRRYLVCDHVQPHRGDETLFFSGPFQTLCPDHHDRDKQRSERVDHKP